MALRWDLIGIAIAGGALGMALISQYVFDNQPCPLCIWQRWPYAVGLGAAAVALAAPGLRTPLLWLAGLSFAVGVGLGVFHSGVEFGWWDGLASCSAPAPLDLSAGELLQRLQSAPLVRCDDRAPYLMGLSMANWNVVVSGVAAMCFALAATAGVRRRALVAA